jgi:hypothetical protein
VVAGADTPDTRSPWPHWYAHDALPGKGVRAPRGATRTGPDFGNLVLSPNMPAESCLPQASPWGLSAQKGCRQGPLFPVAGPCSWKGASVPDSFAALVLAPPARLPLQHPVACPLTDTLAYPRNAINAAP